MRVLLAFLVFMSATVCAQESYPSRPVRVVANFAIGGAIDAVARVVSAKLAESMGQQFVVDNRPGAGGNIGADAAAKAFAPITLAAAAPLVLLAHPALPARDVREFVLLAKKKSLRFASGGSGSAGHLAAF